MVSLKKTTFPASERLFVENLQFNIILDMIPGVNLFIELFFPTCSERTPIRMTQSDTGAYTPESSQAHIACIRIARSANQ